MNEKLGEALSALVDGEADDQALDAVLDNVQDRSLRDTWRRLNAASFSLQPGALDTHTDLSGRIAAAIDLEPAHTAAVTPGAGGEQFGEALSALMDGEADDSTVNQLLDKVGDTSLRDTWRRFNMASLSLQPGALDPHTDLSARVAQAIEHELTATAATGSAADDSEFGEALSALMDGEADSATLDQLLDNAGDASLRATWRRFNTASHSLQSGDLLADTDLSGRIMAALEQEPVYQPQPEVGEYTSAIAPVASWQRFLRPVASFAVAASVFAVVLVGSQFYGVQQGAELSAPVTASTRERLSPTGAVTALVGTANRAGYATPSTVVPVAPTATVNPPADAVTDYDAMARQRLERYMLNHAEEASLNAPQGMMPYARVATFSTEE